MNNIIIKDALLPGAIPFMIMLYTDKTRLGNFTHRKAHGIYATLGNISVSFLSFLLSFFLSFFLSIIN